MNNVEWHPIKIVWDDEWEKGHWEGHLPKLYQRVLVTTKENSLFGRMIEIDMLIEQGEPHTFENNIYDVIAWEELTEPYKE